MLIGVCAYESIFEMQEFGSCRLRGCRSSGQMNKHASHEIFALFFGEIDLIQAAFET